MARRSTAKTRSRVRPSWSRLAMRSAVIAGVITAFVALFLLFWYAADVLLISFTRRAAVAIFLRWSRPRSTPLTGWTEKIAQLGVFGGGLLLLIRWPGLAWRPRRSLNRRCNSVGICQISGTGQGANLAIGNRSLGSGTPPRRQQNGPAVERLLARTASLMTASARRLWSVRRGGRMSLLIGLLLALQPHLYLDGLLEAHADRQTPSGGRGHARSRPRPLKWWLLAKMASMTVIGLLTWLDLWFPRHRAGAHPRRADGARRSSPTSGRSSRPSRRRSCAGLSHGPGVATAVVALYIIVQLIESNLVTRTSSTKRSRYRRR